jgi:hypothetical protein
MEAGHEGEEAVAAVAGLLGLQGHIPAALVLIQAGEEEIHPAMENFIGVGRR